MLGLAGFDWLLLDAEHSPNDVLKVIPQLMALKDSPSAPVVRPQWNDTVQIKRLLDAGFHNFLIPFVQSADEARAAVAATRYPPQGVRGLSVSQRNNKYGTVKDYFKIVNDNIAVMVQIEAMTLRQCDRRDLRRRRCRWLHRSRRSVDDDGPHRQPVAPGVRAAMQESLCQRQSARQAGRDSRAGRSRCPALSRDGRDFRRRRQRSRRFPQRRRKRCATSFFNRFLQDSQRVLRFIRTGERA